MQCINHNEAQSQAMCTRCDRPLCAACLHDFQGKTYCSDCATFVRQRFETRAAQAHATTGAARPTAKADMGAVLDAPVGASPIEPQAGSFARGVLFAMAAGFGAALLWYGSVVVTNYKLGLVAIGVGLLVGFVALLGAGGRGSLPLALASVAIAVASMILGEYMIVNHLAKKYIAENLPGAQVGSFIPVGLFFTIYKETLGFMDFIFYAIGAYEAFKVPASKASG